MNISPAFLIGAVSLYIGLLRLQRLLSTVGLSYTVKNNYQYDGVHSRLFLSKPNLLCIMPTCIWILLVFWTYDLHSTGSLLRSHKLYDSPYCSMTFAIIRKTALSTYIPFFAFRLSACLTKADQFIYHITLSYAGFILLLALNTWYSLWPQYGPLYLMLRWLDFFTPLMRLSSPDICRTLSRCSYLEVSIYPWMRLMFSRWSPLKYQHPRISMARALRPDG